jgi:hypothetical protein
MILESKPNESKKGTCETKDVERKATKRKREALGRGIIPGGSRNGGALGKDLRWRKDLSRWTDWLREQGVCGTVENILIYPRWEKETWVYISEREPEVRGREEKGVCRVCPSVYAT